MANTRDTKKDFQGNPPAPAKGLNPDEIKENVIASLRKPVYNVQHLYKEEGAWPIIAKNPFFENLTLAVVSFNAIWIAYETDNNMAKTLLTSQEIFQVVEQFFCVFFSFEWFVRFMAFKVKRQGFRDSWFLFDSILVFMMVMDTWVMTIVLLLSGAEMSAGGAASMLRLLRLLRLTRLARMLRSVPELMILIRGMVASTRSVFFTLCLLVIVMYMFAILFKQLTRDVWIGPKYFRTIPEAMYTLTLTGTLLDDLEPVVSEIALAGWVYAGLFFLFILLANLTVLNMLIGVLCEVVSAVSDTEKEEGNLAYVKGKMGQIMDQLDENGDRRISKQEFGKLMGNADAVITLNDVGVDPVGLLDFVDDIFSVDPLRFEKNDRVMNESNSLGTVTDCPGGKFYEVKWDGVKTPEMVKRNRMVRAICKGDEVTYKGRLGEVLRNVDDSGLYQVRFYDAEVPCEMMASRAELEPVCEVELSLDDFLQVVMKFRGCNRATIKDMVDVRNCISQTAMALEDKILSTDSLLSGVDNGRANQVTCNKNTRDDFENQLTSVLNVIKHELKVATFNLSCADCPTPPMLNYSELLKAISAEPVDELGVIQKTSNAPAPDFQTDDKSITDRLRRFRQALVCLDAQAIQAMGILSSFRVQIPLPDGPFAPRELRAARLLISRLEVFFLKPWSDELAKAWNIFQDPVGSRCQGGGADAGGGGSADGGAGEPAVSLKFRMLNVNMALGALADQVATFQPALQLSANTRVFSEATRRQTEC